MDTQYNDHVIRVSELSKESREYRYIATDLSGSDTAVGTTEKDAIEKLKNKINCIPAYIDIQSLPKNESEKKQLYNLISDEDNAILIRIKLEKAGYIKQNNNFGIDYRDMLNHLDIIQQALNDKGYHFDLKQATVSPAYSNSFLIIYDSARYNTREKLNNLLNKLARETDEENKL